STTIRQTVSVNGSFERIPYIPFLYIPYSLRIQPLLPSSCNDTAASERGVAVHRPALRERQHVASLHFPAVERRRMPLRQEVGALYPVPRTEVEDGDVGRSARLDGSAQTEQPAGAHAHQLHELFERQH